MPTPSTHETEEKEAKKADELPYTRQSEITDDDDETSAESTSTEISPALPSDGVVGGFGAH